MPHQQGQPQPRPAGKPLWRRAYDAVEKQAATPLEGAVRTATFADAASLAVKLQSRVRRTVTNRTAQLLHLVNLPAASDITRLREQVTLLDHELRQLRHGVEDAAHSTAAGSPRAARAASRPRADNRKLDRTTAKLREASRADPADPVNRVDPADPVNRVDPADPASRVDPVSPADPASRAGSPSPVRPADPATNSANSDNSGREDRDARAAQPRPTRSR